MIRPKTLVWVCCRQLRCALQGTKGPSRHYTPVKVSPLSLALTALKSRKWLQKSAGFTSRKARVDKEKPRTARKGDLRIIVVDPNWHESPHSL